MMRLGFLHATAALAALAAVSAAGATGYKQTNLAATDASFGAPIIDPALANAWGIAIRPAGFGGHFWITAEATGISTEYVGDVGGTPLFQDGLKAVTVPGVGGNTGTPTGVVFNGSKGFSISQDHANGRITNAAKFLFASTDGTVSAWTERNNGNGSFDWPDAAITVIDLSATGSQFFGLGIDTPGDQLLVADFGVDPGLRVFGSDFADISVDKKFANPFTGGAIASGDFTPFNVQRLGDAGIFVAYARYDTAGEEITGAGAGRLAQFNDDGSLAAIWDDRGLLDAPWGLAFAPADFGIYSNALLVGNFGDGTIVAFDAVTRTAIDYLRDPLSGEAISIEGLWGLQFGNGASLGRANALYFAAGPGDETQGLFGRLTAVPEPSAWTTMIAGFGLIGFAARRRRGVKPARSPMPCKVRA